jgi:hypothetical protein
MKHLFHLSRRPFFAVLLSLLLIGSQQAAFAHLLSHAQGSAKALTQLQDNHGSIDGAAETCTSCIAFAGVGGGAPPSSLPLSFASIDGDSYHQSLVVPRCVQLVLSWQARAPPGFL